MKNFSIKGAGIIAVMAILSASVALFAASKDDAKAMVKKVVAYYEKNGRDKTFAEVNKDKGQFEKGEVYVYIFDTNGLLLAHPKLPSWVGKNFAGLKDADGKLFIKDAITELASKNECWIEYKWSKPDTKKIGLKIGYFYKSGDLIFSCGIWK